MMNLHKRQLFVGLLIWLGICLPLVTVQAAYTVTVNPQAVDQSDETIIGTIAWALGQAKLQGGGVIQLQAGMYQLHQALIVPDNTTLSGVGHDTILQATGDQFFDHVLKNIHSDHPQAAGIHHIVLNHLTVIGQRTVRLNCIQLVGSEAQRSSDITLQNVITHDCGRHGIHIKGANNVTMANIVSHHNGVNVDHDHNIYLLRVTGATLSHIKTYQAAGNGLSSTRLVDANISQITSIDNGRRGIRFGAGRAIYLNGCTVSRNGLHLNHQADGIVIVTDDYGNASADIAIQNCTITHNRDHGVWINNAKNIIMKNNRIRHNPVGASIS